MGGGLTVTIPCYEPYKMPWFTAYIKLILSYLQGTRVFTAAWLPGPTPLATATAHPMGGRRLSTWRLT